MSTFFAAISVTLAAVATGTCLAWASGGSASAAGVENFTVAPFVVDGVGVGVEKVWGSGGGPSGMPPRVEFSTVEAAPRLVLPLSTEVDVTFPSPQPAAAANTETAPTSPSGNVQPAPSPQPTAAANTETSPAAQPETRTPADGNLQPATITPTPSHTATPKLEIITPPAKTPPIIGVNYHPYWHANSDTKNRLALLDKYQQAGVTHVRMDVPWGQLEIEGDNIYNTYGVNRLDGYLKELKQRNMKAVVMLWKPPLWSSGRPSPDYPAEGAIDGQPANPAHYGEILAWVANRWPDTIEAIEMWNEPDQSTFWSNGQPGETRADRAASYTDLIQGAYPVAKKAAPNATFILAAPAGLGLHDNWFNMLYQEGIAGNFDAAAVHPYVQPSNTDPTLLPEENNWSVLGIRRVAELLAANGDGGKPIWATEFGFSTHPNNGAERNWLRGVTDAQQGDYLLKTFQQLGSMPQVEGAFVYNDRDYPDPNVHRANFGLLKSDLTPKAGYYALKCAASGVCGKHHITFY